MPWAENNSFYIDFATFWRWQGLKILIFYEYCNDFDVPGVENNYFYIDIVSFLGCQGLKYLFTSV